MKIAIIMPLGEQRGGAELALLHLIQQGCRADVEWLVIFLQEGPMVAQVRELGAAARVVTAGRLRQLHRYPGAVRQIARLLASERADVVVGWMSYAQLYGGVASRLARVPALWFQHGLPLDKNWMDRLATRIPAQGILACSQAGVDAQVQIMPRRPMRVVHPGVELGRFDPEILPMPSEARQRLGLPSSGPLVGIVGRLQRWKGMHVLVEAMHGVLARYPDAHCVIVGGEHAFEADYPAFLRGRIEALGLQEKVILVGLQKNVPEWMQAMDVLVHASDKEPFGIVVIEAMALGKPVVAGNAAGPTEVITDGVNGLLTAYGDSQGLADAILRYLDHPGFARSVARAARERAQEFSTRRYADNFIIAVREFLMPPPPV